MNREKLLGALFIAMITVLLTACSSSDYIMKINNEIVTPQEYNLYLSKGIEYYEQQGGEEVWDMPIDGEDMATALKNGVVDTITRKKIQADVAKGKKITLDDSEKKQLATTVNSYFIQADANSKYSRSTVEKFVTDNMIVSKLYDFETKNIEVTDKMFNEYLAANGVKDKTQLSEQELNNLKDKCYGDAKMKTFNEKYNKWKENYKIEVNNEELSKIEVK